jgi:copper chaperone CopZ
MNILHITLISIVLFCITNITYAQSISKEDSLQTSQNIIQVDTMRYVVYGMDCPGCEGGLEKQVNKIPSVKFSKANWVNQELIIVLKHDSVLNPIELEKRVKKANFTLDTNQKKKKE